MHSKVDVKDLKVGMFVADLDRPWIDTPFLIQGFIIEDRQQIAELQRVCEFVIVDRARSAGVEFRKPSALGPAPAPVAAPPTSRIITGTSSIQIEEAPTAKGDLKKVAAPERPPEPPKRRTGGLMDSLRGLLRRPAKGLPADAAELPPEPPRASLLPPSVPVTIYPDTRTVEEEVAPARKAYDRSSEMLRKLASDVWAGHPVEIARVEEVVDEMVESMVRNPDALMWVARLREQDITTYGHGLQVAVYLVAFGRHLGFPRAELSQLGTIGLLLDIGKLKLPRPLLQKHGRLTPEEFETVKGHVALGLEILSATPNWPVEVLEGIAQHHERMNGSGYPRALKGEQIGIFGRMAGIVRLFRRAHEGAALRGGRLLVRGPAQHHGLGRRVLPRAPHGAVRPGHRRVPGGLPRGALDRRGGGGRLAQQGPAAEAARPPAHRARQDARGLPDHGRPALRPAPRRRGARVHPPQPADRGLRPRPARQLPFVNPRNPPAEPGFHLPPGGDGAREELLRFLDRETAIAQATKGRLGVLIVELRRVDRLQALLKGPPASITISLVLERLRPALRPEDRMAPLNEEQVCIVLPRLAHPTQAVLAAVKCLRALDRPIAHEGGTAILRPCVGIATVPEHTADAAHLLMAADVARRIAGTREEGYHVYQNEDSVEAEVYHGLDIDLQRAIRSNELEVHYQPQVEPRGRDRRRRGGAAALAAPHRGAHLSHHRRGHRREHRHHRLAHLLGPERGAALRRPAREGRHHPALQREPVHPRPRRRRAAGHRRAGPRHVERAAGADHARDHGKLDDRGRRAVDGHAHAPEGHRRAARHRRLRHGLLVARLPQALAHRRAQDRPPLRRAACSPTAATTRSSAP